MRRWWLAVVEAIDTCFRRHPALFFGICLFAGAWIGLGSQKERVPHALLCLLPLLFLPLWRTCLAVLVITAAFFSTSLRVVAPSFPMSSKAALVAEVSDRHIFTIHGKTLWRIDLFVRALFSDKGTLLAKGIHLNIHSPLPCGMVGGKMYRMNGVFSMDESLQPRFKPDWATLHEDGKTFSFVEKRVAIRRKMEKIFVSLFKDQEERSVAGALTFGLNKDPYFQHLMHRAGVEHVLAISGFHFGLVAALILLFLRALRASPRVIISIVVLTSYLLVVGPLPSVMRSWWAGMVALVGVFLGKKSSGLNCLGVGLTAAVLFYPETLSQAGCQLSFLATAAILFFSSLVLQQNVKIISQKTREQFASFSFVDQVLSTVLQRVFPSLSLIVPVWAVIVPYQLGFMQDVSFLGMIYNLCIPLLFSLAMPCVFLAVLCYPLSIVSHFLAWLGSIPLHWGILLVHATPEGNWTSMDGGVISQPLVTGLIIAIFLLGCIFEGRNENQRSDAWKACI